MLPKNRTTVCSVLLSDFLPGLAAGGFECVVAGLDLHRGRPFVDGARGEGLFHRHFRAGQSYPRAVLMATGSSAFGADPPGEDTDGGTVSGYTEGTVALGCFLLTAVRQECIRLKGIRRLDYAVSGSSAGTNRCECGAVTPSSNRPLLVSERICAVWSPGSSVGRSACWFLGCASALRVDIPHSKTLHGDLGVRRVMGVAHRYGLFAYMALLSSLIRGLRV